MKQPHRTLIALGLGAALALPALAADEGKIVIAHRGASGYLPEHTLESKALAYGMGADYLEQDLVMTKDDQLVVMHDHFLDGITDVAERFPGRARPDGRYYVVDFTLDEVRSLRMTEPFQLVDGKQVPVYPARFPLWKSSFRIHTFQEEIEMIQGLNKSTGKHIGIYPEIKAPWLFQPPAAKLRLVFADKRADYRFEPPHAGAQRLRFWLRSAPRVAATAPEPARFGNHSPHRLLPASHLTPFGHTAPLVDYIQHYGKPASIAARPR